MECSNMSPLGTWFNEPSVNPPLRCILGYLPLRQLSLPGLGRISSGFGVELFTSIAQYLLVNKIESTLSSQARPHLCVTISTH